MSRIDASPIRTGTSAAIPEARLARIVARGQPVGGPPEPEARVGVRSAEGFREREDAAPRVAPRPVLSVGAIPDADLQPIAELGSEALIGELARIDLLLKGRGEGFTDSGARETFEAGRAMIAENIRRLRLVHRGHDALVLKAS